MFQAPVVLYHQGFQHVCPGHDITKNAWNPQPVVRLHDMDRKDKMRLMQKAQVIHETFLGIIQIAHMTPENIFGRRNRRFVQIPVDLLQAAEGFVYGLNGCQRSRPLLLNMPVIAARSSGVSTPGNEDSVTNTPME